MKFKKLNEGFTSDDLYNQVANYIYDRLNDALDNMAYQVASEMPEYDLDYCSEETTESSQKGDNALRKAAEFFAEHLTKNAPDVIAEKLTPDEASIKLLDEVVLSTKKGTVSNILSDSMEEIKECTSVDELLKLLNDILPDKQKNEPKVKQFLNHIAQARTLNRAYAALANFILAGDGLGVIK